MIKPGAEYRNSPNNSAIKTIIMIFINNDLNLNTNTVHSNSILIEITQSKLMTKLMSFEITEHR